MTAKQEDTIRKLREEIRKLKKQLTLFKRIKRTLEVKDKEYETIL